MGFRIGKNMTSLIPSQWVRRTDAKGEDQQRRQNQESNSQREREPQHDPSYEELLRVVEEEKQALSSHNPSHLEISVIKAGNSGIVRVSTAEGQLIREMTGNEFIRLKQSSHLANTSRGKVFDQKF